MARDRDNHDDALPRAGRESDADAPPPPRDNFDREPQKAGNGMAVASLVLGLLSLCFGPTTGLIGGILGLVGLIKPKGKGLAVTGLLLSFVFSAAWSGVGVWWFLQVQKYAKERLNYATVGLATHTHHDTDHAFPLAYHGRLDFTRPPGSDFTDRLSWRVAVLRFLEQDKLYLQFKADEPWDSPANRPHADKVVKPYTDVESPTDPNTRVRVFYDNGAMFDSRGQTRLVDVTDGTSYTIMQVEGGDKVTWTRFQEYRYAPDAPLPALGKPNQPTFLVVTGDGSVRTVRKTIAEKTLRAMITRNGGEVKGYDDGDVTPFGPPPPPRREDRSR
jgi:hypothetical protein